MNQQNQRALLLHSIVGQFEQRVKKFLDYAEAHPEVTFAELEAEARRLSRDCFAPALAGVVEGRQAVAEARVGCSCGELAAYKGDQPRSQETYVGRIQWRRGYYYCSACGRGRYPSDEVLGIAAGEFSDGVQAGISRLGAALPFEPAAETFLALTGISVSGREGERLTEGRGAALEGQLARERKELLKGQGQTAPSQALAKSGVWSVALDAAKVRFDDGWHDVKAGTVFWAESTRREDGRAQAQAQSYVVEVGSLEQAGARLYAETARRGVDAAEELVVCLGDGAPGNWNQFALHFPKRAEILDWWHAVEHVWAAGNGVFGEGVLAAKGWVEDRKTELWEGKVEEVISALRQAAAQPQGKAAEEEIHYFETNKERMRYDKFRAKGYPIGSGTVESACKRVIGARVKQAGMCWTKPGAQTVLSLRAALLSGRWDEAWQVTRPVRKAA